MHGDCATGVSQNYSFQNDCRRNCGRAGYEHVWEVVYVKSVTHLTNLTAAGDWPSLLVPTASLL
jgi:hypothetical protein